MSRLSPLCLYQMLQNRYHAVMVERKDNANSALYHASLVISEINSEIFSILIKNEYAPNVLLLS